MARSGERGPIGQKKERVAYILARSRQFVPVSQIRAECIKEWDISATSWQRYWKEVSKYLERVTLRQAKDYKGIVLGQLESLLPECQNIDSESGEIKRDVIKTRLVLGDIRDLLGLDAPKKTEVDQVVTTVVDPELQKSLVTHNPSTEPLPEAPTE